MTTTTDTLEQRENPAKDIASLQRRSATITIARAVSYIAYAFVIAALLVRQQAYESRQDAPIATHPSPRR